MRLPTSCNAIPLLGVALLSLGCGDPGDADNGLPVASVGAEILTGTQLTAILLKSPAAPTRLRAVGMTSMWIDHALVMEALSRNLDLTGDSILSDISTTETIDRTIRSYADLRGMSGSPPESTQIDSLQRLDRVKVFRVHRFELPVDDDSLRAVYSDHLFDVFSRTVNGETITESLSQLPGDVARELTSEESPAVSYSEMPEELARAVWRLAEGEVSGPLVGDGGVQLFERLSAAESRSGLAAWLRPALQGQADRRFTDSLVAASAVEIAEDAGPRVRQALAEPIELTGAEPLATWTGGSLLPEEAAMWIGAMTPAARANLSDGSESDLEAMVETMVRRRLFFDLALGSTEIDTAAIRSAVHQEFRDAIPALWNGVASREDQNGAPMGMALSWVTSILDGERPYQQLPGSLAGWLRSRISVSVDGRALDVAGREAGRLWVDPRLATQ